jgi:PAS domain-containing protein
MAKDIATYMPLVDETTKKFGIGKQNSKLGIVLHRVYVDGTGNASDYEPTELNDAFTELTGVSVNQLSGLRYSSLFPETKEIKFDWIAVLGQSSTSIARTKFYIFSEALKKWFSILAFSPEKGYSIMVFDDITIEKNEEIQRMIAIQAKSPVVNDND